MPLTREEILAAKDVRFETVQVPGWGGEVRIRSMTGADRDQFEQWATEAKGEDGTGTMDNPRARLACMSIVGEDGERLFTEADIIELGKKSAVALDAVYTAAVRLNVLSAAGMEAIAKN